MSKKNSVSISFVPKCKAVVSTTKINFIPNKSVKRVLKSNHSDINELKSYLNPRRTEY